LQVRGDVKTMMNDDVGALVDLDKANELALNRVIRKVNPSL